MVYQRIGYGRYLFSIYINVCDRTVLSPGGIITRRYQGDSTSIRLLSNLITRNRKLSRAFGMSITTGLTTRLVVR